LAIQESCVDTANLIHVIAERKAIRNYLGNIAERKAIREQKCDVAQRFKRFPTFRDN